MTNEFVKLDIGESVASGSGMAWKKLVKQPPRLSAPTISLDGVMLAITDNSSLAASIDILVDGEVRAEANANKVSYNGVELPPLPAVGLANYPYAWIRNNTASGHYDLLLCTAPRYYDSGSIYPADSKRWYRIEIASASSATEWVPYETNTNAFGVDTGRTVLWSNHDIPNGSATATDIYFEGTEPVPVSILGYTFNLSLLGFSEGNYSITAKAKAEGYSDSLASNAVSYVPTAQDFLIGTWVFKIDMDSYDVSMLSNNYSRLLYSDNSSDAVVARMGTSNIVLNELSSSLGTYFGIQIEYDGYPSPIVWVLTKRQDRDSSDTSFSGDLSDVTLEIYAGDYKSDDAAVAFLQANAIKVA